ncbi:F-box/LRR-repeat protein At4g14103-like [Cornus florida]|uniref:F-box/LRR-repeat protein At4g14103-like n=1 Tax=Cornus florida TaxID=4283 RepID=UPI00289792A8|nr:F-box/LRR-repeat protein At4g14103-like [Cornus florida]
MMHSVYKCGGRFKKVEVEENEDIISNLPSCLMDHILSFLPTKYAVATSVLSTKWKYLWTSITNLDFDDELLVEPINPQECTEQKLRSVEMSFINFIDRVLLHNISYLHTFRLRCTRSYDVSHLNVLVTTVLARKLHELHLFFQMEYYNGLAREVFTCTNLEVLELVGRFVLNVPTLVCLQNLKILLINKLGFSDDESIHRLLSGCPLLEELSIKRCDLKNISVLCISAPALKSLVINCWSKGGYKLVLNTPNLQDLEYYDYVAKGYLMNKLNGLVNADISLFLRHEVVHDNSVEELVAEFVEGISEVQRLRLSYYDSTKLCRSPLPIFVHLTCLDISCKNYLNVFWKSLLDFLESSPQLEKLIFAGLLSQEEVEENQTTYSWYPPEYVPSCLLFHLKDIYIRWFKGEIDELKMVEYFLKNSKVLEKLMIKSFIDRKSAEICTLQTLPRGSEKCRVVVF